MKSWLAWTLATLTTLGAARARADDAEPTTDALAVQPGVTLAVERSHRGVAQEYLVLPSGGELSGQMRFVMAQPVFSADPVRFSDLALFGLGGRWALHPRLEVSGTVNFLAKQPSFTDEKPWQSVGLGLRTPLGPRSALALAGAGGHLIDHSGMWTQESLSLEWRKPIARMMTFDLAGGANAVSLSAPGKSTALVGEVAASAQVLFHADRIWGSWVGVGYALPVLARGMDPVRGVELDPQPRLDLRIGTVLSLVKEWDVFAELAIIDRGDLGNAATTLPMLDGGFDQQQVILGVTRHIEGSRRRTDPMMISQR